MMPIGKSSGCHVARGKSSDPRHLSPLFAHVVDLMIAWTRVHAIAAVRKEIGRSPRVHVTCKVKKSCGNIVPHGLNGGRGRG